MRQKYVPPDSSPMNVRIDRSLESVSGQRGLEPNHQLVNPSTLPLVKFLS